MVKLLATAVVAAMMPMPACAEADGFDTDYLMTGCRDFLMRDQTRPMIQGTCVGTVVGVWGTLEYYEQVCAPRNMTNGEALRIVIKYFDERPDRSRTPLYRLTVEALQTAWPCVSRDAPSAPARP